MLISFLLPSINFFFLLSRFCSLMFVYILYLVPFFFIIIIIYAYVVRSAYYFYVFYDYYLLIIDLIFQFQAALLQRWNLPEFMCPFCPFVQTVSVNVSVFTLTAIAVDRHRAIINPLR